MPPFLHVVIFGLCAGCDIPSYSSANANADAAVIGGQSGTGGTTGHLDAARTDAEVVPCQSDEDCASAATAIHCGASGHCVQCIAGVAGCAPGLYCTQAGACAPGCATNTECAPSGLTPSAQLTCDNHTCTGCGSDAECPPGSLCDSTARCVPGSCTLAHACAAGWLCCAGECLEAAATARGCSLCPNLCSNAHGETACVDDACVPSCADGYGDCDKNPNNGCESTFDTTANCLSCGNSCANEHGPTTCTANGCKPTCAAAYESCDLNPNNGCETSLNTDPNNCQTCGHQCAFPGAVAGCAGGQCMVDHCLDDFRDCDHNPTNGCEIDTTSDPVNCGACGLTCKNEHGDTRCVNGKCVPDCLTGYGDCDGLASNGCETNTNNDTQNCHECHNVCAADGGEPNCVAGVCSVSHCAAGLGDCNADGTCETRLDGEHNCGHCGTECSSAHGTPTCVARVDGGYACTITCDPLWGDCDSKTAGCETQVNTLSNCAGCGIACLRDHMKTTCATGTCLADTAAGSPCTDGYNDCNTAPADGCESNPKTDLENCGGCGTKCLNPHGQTTCVNGACVPTCDSGWAVCSEDPATGCSVDITTTSHCGATCAPCAGAESLCVSGTCKDDQTIAVHGPAAVGKSTSNLLTLSHTLATGPGNMRVVLLGLVLRVSNSTSPSLTATYGDASPSAMIPVNPKYSGNQAWAGIYLIGDAALPAAGTHTVTISSSQSVVLSTMATVLEFTGVDQANPIETSNAIARSSCASPSDTLTFASTKPWGFEVLGIGGQSATPTAGSGQTSLLTNLNDNNVVAAAGYQGPIASSPASFNWGNMVGCNASSHVVAILQRGTK